MLWSILVVMLPSVVTHRSALVNKNIHDVVVYSCCNATFSCHSQVWSIMMLWSILVVMLPSVVLQVWSITEGGHSTRIVTS